MQNGYEADKRRSKFAWTVFIISLFLIWKGIYFLEQKPSVKNESGVICPKKYESKCYRVTFLTEYGGIYLRKIKRATFPNGSTISLEESENATCDYVAKDLTCKIDMYDEETDESWREDFIVKLDSNARYTGEMNEY